MGLQAAYANLHTDQERDYFMQRYHDVISSFGGTTSYDADNRPLLVMRSNLWASGYDVDGTVQTSLGQFAGRVQQTYKHSVARFFVFVFASRRRHTIFDCDWSSDVCSSDLDHRTRRARRRCSRRPEEPHQGPLSLGERWRARASVRQRDRELRAHE